MLNPLQWIRPVSASSSASAKSSAKQKLKSGKKQTATRKQAMRSNPDNGKKTASPMIWQTYLRSHPRLIWVLAIVLFASLLVYLLPKEQWLPIERIRLSGSFDNIDTMALETQLQPYLGQGFFILDIDAIQSRISQRPWVRNASVRRIWPNQIYVSIEEKQAVARWDKKNLLSARGKIFEASGEQFSQLPVINGYPSQTVELLHRFKALNLRLSDLGLSIDAMREDSKGALTLEFKDGLKLSLGSQDSDRKVDYFVAVYRQQIEPRLNKIQHIDFRYSNGFAIAWKQDELKKSAETEKKGNKNV